MRHAIIGLVFCCLTSACRTESALPEVEDIEEALNGMDSVMLNDVVCRADYCGPSMAGETCVLVDDVLFLRRIVQTRERAEYLQARVEKYRRLGRPGDAERNARKLDEILNDPVVGEADDYVRYSFVKLDAAEKRELLLTLFAGLGSKQNDSGGAFVGYPILGVAMPGYRDCDFQGEAFAERFVRFHEKIECLFLERGATFDFDELIAIIRDDGFWRELAFADRERMDDFRRAIRTNRSRIFGPRCEGAAGEGEADRNEEAGR